MTIRKIDACAWKRPAAVVAIVVACGLWMAGSPAGWAYAQEKKESKQHEGMQKFSGKVQQVRENTLTIVEEGDATRQIQTESDTRITLNGKQVSLDNLKEGDQVTVRMRQDRPEMASMVRASREGEAAKAALGAILIQSPEGEIGVWRVAPRGPAAKAGLQRGDAIVQVDGKKINSPQEVTTLIEQKKPGEQVQITFQRDGQEQTVTATLATREGLFGTPRQERRAARQAVEEEEGTERGEAWLGVLLGEKEDEGVRVVRVFPESPAANAGVKRGDILRSLNDEKVESAEAAQQVLEQMKPDEKVQLHITRDGQEQTLEATLGDRESRREAFSRFRERMARERRGEEPTGRIEEMLHDMKEDLKQDIQDLRDEVRKLREENESKK
jgi:serine protease Do